jgi:hypothetical protein
MPRLAGLVLIAASHACGLSIAAARSSLARPATRACALRMMAPPNGLVDNFLVTGYENKTEVEQAFGVVVSEDASLWDDNAFLEYVGPEWVQSSVEKVVLLFTYLALNSFAKLSVRMGANTMEEEAILPWGRRPQNEWVVYGCAQTGLPIHLVAAVL